jgi:hypothetical protein
MLYVKHIGIDRGKAIEGKQVIVFWRMAQVAFYTVVHVSPSCHVPTCDGFY